MQFASRLTWHTGYTLPSRGRGRLLCPKAGCNYKESPRGRWTKLSVSLPAESSAVVGDFTKISERYTEDR